MKLEFVKDGQPVTELLWEPPTTYVDNSPYGEVDHEGYELGTSDPDNATDGFTPFVSIPAAYSVTTWPLVDLGIQAPGDFEVALRVIAKNGQVSEWSNSETFEANDVTVPKPPTSLAVGNTIGGYVF